MKTDNFERVEDAERIVKSDSFPDRLDQCIKHAEPEAAPIEYRFGELEPNATYEKHGYIYKTDDQGRTRSAEGKSELKEIARSDEQLRVGKLGQEGD